MKSGNTGYAMFKFEPSFRVDSLARIYECLGGRPWNEVLMTEQQLRDFTYLLPPTNALATEVNGIPIVVYGSTDEIL